MLRPEKASQPQDVKLYLLYGFGRSLRSVAKYLNSNNISFVVHDDSPKIIEEVKQLEYKTSEDIQNFNTNELTEEITDIVVAPGISPDNLIFNSKIKIWNDISLFADLFQSAKLIGVTGSFGKSTTTEVVRHVYIKQDPNVQIAGNIGIPIFDCNPDHPIIVELSAQQLELCERIKLDVAIILNIYPHHLERYLTLANYSKTKYQIFNLAKIKIANLALGYKCITISTIDKNADYYFDGNFIYEKGKQISKSLRESVLSGISVIGAFAVLRSLNFSPTEIIGGILDFPGLGHRCEIIKSSLTKITFVNDSKSTNLLNSIYCLQRFSGKIAWIAGGKIPKNTTLPDNDKITLKKLPKLHYIATFGESKDILYEHLKDSFNIAMFNNLKECIISCINKGSDIIVLSPGYSSFDMYDNFMDRGEHFKTIISKLVP